jgi:hypothetical protein
LRFGTDCARFSFISSVFGRASMRDYDLCPTFLSNDVFVLSNVSPSLAHCQRVEQCFLARGAYPFLIPSWLMRLFFIYFSRSVQIAWWEWGNRLGKGSSFRAYHSTLYNSKHSGCTNLRQALLSGYGVHTTDMQIKFLPAHLAKRGGGYTLLYHNHIKVKLKWMLIL